MLYTSGEAGTNSKATFPDGLLGINTAAPVDQQRLTYISSGWILVTRKDGERELKDCVLSPELDDIYIYIYIVIHRQICFVLSELISVARHISFP